MMPVVSVHGLLSFEIIRAPKQHENMHRGVDADRFKTFVNRCIVPHLQPYPNAHSVVLMDRASIHFRPDIIELIERRGAHVLACAPHCPWVRMIRLFQNETPTEKTQDEKLSSQPRSFSTTGL